MRCLPLCLVAAFACGESETGLLLQPSPIPPAPIEPNPNEEPEAPVTPRALERCDHVLRESHVCLGKPDRELILIGLDSGSVCGLGVSSEPFVHREDRASLFWDGAWVYVCRPGDSSSELTVVERISLLTGERDIVIHDCSAIAVRQGEIVIYDRGPLRDGRVITYPSWDSVGHAGNTQQPARELFATRFAVAGDLVYGSWHSTDAVERLHLDDPLLELPPIRLGGYAGWVRGFGVTEDGWIVYHDVDDRLVVLDAEAQSTRATFRGLGPTPLSCITNG